MKQDNRGRFVKGRSGNPGGRPRIPESVREAARAHTAVAIATLAEVMNDKQQTGAARVAAADKILDRGWGKAPQHIAADYSSVENLTDAELDAELEAALVALRDFGAKTGDLN